MLVLSRKPGEKIRLGSDIVVTVVEVTGQRVRLGIDAPAEVSILRSELQTPQSPDTDTVATSTMKTR